MGTKKVIYRVVLFATLLGVCSFCSCRRDPGGVVEDSNNFHLNLPCWGQSWECGNWKLLESDLDGKWVLVDTGYEGNGGISICDNCGSVRILDFGNKKERTLFSSTSRFQPSEYEWAAGLSNRQLGLDGFDPIVGEHKWIAGLSRRSFDLIEAGDVLVVQQRHYLFIFMIQPISGVGLGDQEVTYKFAKFRLKDKWPIKVDLSKVKWKEKKKHNVFAIAGRGIEFDLFPTHWTNSKPKFVEIFYDQYYGGSYGPKAVTGNDVAKIAIIHKDDVKADNIVDFRRYRFKCWEDGLGNKCGEGQKNVRTPLHSQTVQ